MAVPYMADCIVLPWRCNSCIEEFLVIHQNFPCPMFSLTIANVAPAADSSNFLKAIIFVNTSLHQKFVSYKSDVQ